MPVSTPTRRTFLQTALAAAASLCLPRFLRARAKPRSFWFLHTASGESWAVDDPVVWSLEKARQPILERARERLVTLDALLQLGRVCVKCPLLHTEERKDVLVCGYTAGTTRAGYLGSSRP